MECQIRNWVAQYQGAQMHPISTCIKRFAANNQETSRRDKDDSVMTERVLREERGFDGFVVTDWEGDTGLAMRYVHLEIEHCYLCATGL